MRVSPAAAPLRGRLRLPGSKSLTNRALLLAGVASGRSTLRGVLRSDDTRYMSAALAQLGVDIDTDDPLTWTVSGRDTLAVPAAPLFLGNAGTATRFLTAMVARVSGTVIVTGDHHMQQRPIAPLVDALSRLGVSAQAPTGCPPVTVHGTGSFDAGHIAIDGGLSSQYVSAVLMLAPFSRRALDVDLGGSSIDARGYIDLTLSTMRAFGAHADECGDGRWRIAPTGYSACDYTIEPDASAATYLWAAEALGGGRIELGIDPATMTQPDARALDFIRRFPAMPAVIDGSQMQDAVPTLAVLAAFNDKPVRFTGIANLRVKECDRIRALAQEVGKLGVQMTREEGDELRVAGASALHREHHPVHIDSWQDHRIAMSLALAGLRRPQVHIHEPDCVAKTYPAYWDDLATLGVSLERRDSRGACPP